jgi:hypothetical protein
MLNQIITILYPVLNAILVGLLAYIGAKVVKLVPKVVEFVVAKIGLTNYQKIQLFGKDVWNAIEEFYRLNPVIGDTIKAKQTMFTTQMKIKVPGITDAMIEDVRQAIAGEFNKDKPAVVKAIQDEVTPIVNVVSVVPMVKYVTPEGVELKPIDTASEVTVIQPATPAPTPDPASEAPSQTVK